MIHKVIQWNCRGYKANYNELLLLIAELNPTATCCQETFKKTQKNCYRRDTKTFEQYNYIPDIIQKALGRV